MTESATQVGSGGRQSEKPLFAERHFVGRLFDEAQLSVVVNFVAAIDASGVLILRFDSIDMDLSAFQRLHRVFDGQRIEWLQLEAHADDGTSLVSKRFVLGELGTSTAHDVSRITIGGHCASVQFTFPILTKEKYTTINRVVCFRLRGLQCFTAPLRLSIQGLGNVVLQCPWQLEPESRSTVTGFLAITATDDEDDTMAADATWLERAVEAGEDILTALSAVSGAQLTARIIEKWPGDGTKVVIVRRTLGGPQDGIGMALQAVTDQALKPFLEAVAVAVVNPEVSFKALKPALQWLAIPTSQTEVRLFCAATAIENMLALGLEGDDQRYLPRAEFQKALDASREALKRVLAHLPDEALERLLPGNHAGLKTKIERLLLKWGATAEHISEVALRDAVKARNEITHRGINSVPSASGQVEAWPHAMVLREIALRLVFARLGYKGSYISFIGRRQERSFP